jgi:hypothetical protein
MYRWAKVMQGRVVIYDYDQGMLVWRDIPCPSIQSIRQDIKHYRKAGILGLSTESRGAMATVFLNLHVRGRLYWDPDTDVDALLAEFHEKFYGPAAKPMAALGHRPRVGKSIVTEHEHFLLPAVYTPSVIAECASTCRLRSAGQTAGGEEGVGPQRETLPGTDEIHALGFECTTVTRRWSRPPRRRGTARRLSP